MSENQPCSNTTRPLCLYVSVSSVRHAAPGAVGVGDTKYPQSSESFRTCVGREACCVVRKWYCNVSHVDMTWLTFERDMLQTQEKSCTFKRGARCTFQLQCHTCTNCMLRTPAPRHFSTLALPAGYCELPCNNISLAIANKHSIQTAQDK